MTDFNILHILYHTIARKKEKERNKEFDWYLSIWNYTSYEKYKRRGKEMIDFLSSHIYYVKFVWLEDQTTINEIHVITKYQPLSSLWVETSWMAVKISGVKT